jgi:hypothetical protein
MSVIGKFGGTRQFLEIVERICVSLDQMHEWSRRSLLRAALVSALAWPLRGFAFGEASRLVFAQLRHAGRWDPHPDGLPRLAWEVAKRTSIETSPVVKALAPSDPELFRYPFSVLSSDAAVPSLADAEVSALRRYLSYGGFLLVDDASAQSGGSFERSARDLLAKVLPAAKLKRVARDHVLYKSFYLLDGATGRSAARPDLEAIDIGGRLAVLYSPNDLVGALARDSLGTWEMEVVPGGEGQREKAVRLGVNLAMYALCLDYKEDQVHIPFIMKRRRI